MSEDNQFYALLAGLVLSLAVLFVFAELRTAAIRGERGYVDCRNSAVNFCEGPACDAAPAVCVEAK